MVRRSNPYSQLTTTTVLAFTINLYILWTFEHRSFIPCVLPSTILEASRGSIRTIAGTVLMAVVICNFDLTLALALGVDAFLGIAIIEYTRVHLESTEPRHQLELPGSSRIRRSIPTLGFDGIQLDLAWSDTQGRDYGSCCRTRSVKDDVIGIACANLWKFGTSSTMSIHHYIMAIDLLILLDGGVDSSRADRKKNRIHTLIPSIMIWLLVERLKFIRPSRS
jgi:hypothetical protein